MNLKYKMFSYLKKIFIFELVAKAQVRPELSLTVKGKNLFLYMLMSLITNYKSK